MTHRRPAATTPDEVQAAQHHLQALLERPFAPWPEGVPFTPWTGALGRGIPSMEPPADVEETADAFVIEVDLPGVAKSDVQVEHAGRQVIITAERRERERVGQLRTGTCRVGSFRLVIDLPCDTSETGVGAALADGVLTVRVPKLNPAATRRIPVA